jgi:hypothetical protein
MTSLGTFLLDNLWPGVVVWSALYVSDYSLTLACARLYQRSVSERIVFEGSFEITPYFQSDIDSLRVVSPRFLAAMVLTWVYLAAVWWLASQSQPHLYEFVLGALISSQLAVHVRHFRNFFLFRAIAATDAVQGRIQYPRPLILRMSSVELLAFSVSFGVLFVFTSSWFLLGGAIACLGIALKHRRLANKHVANVTNKAAGVRAAGEPILSERISQ